MKNPIIRFLVIVFALYILWYAVYELWLHPQGNLDLFLIDITINMSKWILELLNYKVFKGHERVVGIDGTGGLFIGDSCNGINLFALFAGFIIAFKGKVKHKFFYILLGIIVIQLLNVLRIVCLAILDTYSRNWTEFNHTYTFTALIYACIFMLWMIWVNKYASMKTNKLPT